MTSRRLRLSLVRRSESPMSPIGDRTRSSISEQDVSSASQCSTPLNNRKRVGSIKSDSPVFNDIDHSPISTSQDTSNVVTGVSWAWNSPKRAIVADQRARLKPLTNKNIISKKDSDFSRSNREKSIKKLTGFARFQTELQRLQERDEFQDTDMEMDTASCSSLQVVPPTSPAPSPDKDSSFVLNRHKTSKKNKSSKNKTKALPFFKPNPTSLASDSFNDSELDILLLQASQAVETHPSVSSVVSNKQTTEKSSDKRRSFFRRKTTDDFDLNSDDSFAESELNVLLAQISGRYGQSSAPKEDVSQNINATSEPSTSKTKGLLTRHKSMPESPSRLITEPIQSSTMKYATENAPLSPITVSSTSSASIIYVPTKTEVVVVPSSSGSSTMSESSSTGIQPMRVCSKEEIEQKRQEALKRQACRLKRLMQGKHSQGGAKFFKQLKQ